MIIFCPTIVPTLELFLLIFHNSSPLLRDMNSEFFGEDELNCNLVAGPLQITIFCMVCFWCGGIVY